MKSIIIKIVVCIVIIFSLVIGYNFYCNSVLEDIRDEFISIFVNGVDEETKNEGYFVELKNDLYERKNYVIQLEPDKKEESINFDDTLSILPEEEEEFTDEELQYLYYDKRPIIDGIGEIEKVGGFYYSNSNSIYLNDFDFSKSRIVEVIFKNYIISLYAEDYPKSYNEILSSSYYNFYYTHTEKRNGKYILYFQNESNTNTVELDVNFKWLVKPEITISYLNF